MLPLETNDRIALLVAEDDPHWRKILRKTLPSDPVVVEDGEAALDLFARRPVDVLLTDLMMPGIGGLDLMRVVKQTDPSCRVILMSAHATLDSVVEALNGGAAYFWEKTRPADELARVVTRLLEERAGEHRTRWLAAELLRRSSELSRPRPDDTDTALRLLVELYQATLRALPDGVAVVDAAGRIVLANAALGEHVGQDPGSLAGQPLSAVAAHLPSGAAPRPLDATGGPYTLHVFPAVSRDP